MPEVGEVPNLDFPDIQRARLSNGMEIVYAQRSAVPVTRVAVSFDAGNAADPKNRLGTQALTLALLDEGTRTRNSIQIAEEQERLGARIGAGATMDRTVVSLSALTPNLAPSLDLLADIVRNPAFDPAEVERLRGEQLARIASELTQPQAIALRALPPVLYGPITPMGSRSPARRSQGGGAGEPRRAGGVSTKAGFGRTMARSTWSATGRLPKSSRCWSGASATGRRRRLRRASRTSLPQRRRQGRGSFLSTVPSRRSR
jgi:hypothetical protein